MNEPLNPVQAKAEIRRILKTGFVSYVTHAMKRMAERNVTAVDVENVLRGGVVGPAEWENGTWRYPVFTNRFHVVVEFVSDENLLVITVIRRTP